MSFAGDVKNELARIIGQECCMAAELVALMRMGGTMVIGGNRTLGVNFKTENAAVARKALTLLKTAFQLRSEVIVTRGRRLKKGNTYSIRVLPSAAVNTALAAMGFVRDDHHLNRGKDGGLLRRACCRRAYLRGAFLGGGSVNRPEGDYHLELVTGNRDFAKTLLRLLRTFQLQAGLTDRKEDYVVYLKDGDGITAFLQIIGAQHALLEFENVRVVKDMRNQVNRLVNCETANLQKTVNAAVRQIDFIRLIADTIGFTQLPPALRETAEARLANPEANLQELVDAIGGKVSRSGVNHRLRKLEQIARDIEERISPR